MNSVKPFAVMVQGLLVAAWLAVALVLYFTPTLLGWRQRAEHLRRIAAVNLFLGITGIGWFLALFWAIKARPQSETPPSRG